MPVASDIADYLGLALVGRDIEVTSFSQLNAPLPNTLVFAKKFSDSAVETLDRHDDILAIVAPSFEGRLECPHLTSANPRLDFIRALAHFFAPHPCVGGIHPTAVIAAGAQIGQDVSIGAHCYIAKDCIVGDGCVLHANVVLDNRVVLGRCCEIKSGAVLGQEGFGFERDEQGNPLHFPHFGDVVVGDNVFIGSNSTVERATLGSTIIENNVKIDDLVQIGHNSHIGEGSMITVGAIVCGGAVLKAQSYLAPNVSVKEKVVVGQRGFAGLGAVVIKDIADNSIVVGNPAKPLNKQ